VSTYDVAAVLVRGTETEILVGERDDGGRFGDAAAGGDELMVGTERTTRRKRCGGDVLDARRRLTSDERRTPAQLLQQEVGRLEGVVVVVAGVGDVQLMMSGGQLFLQATVAARTGRAVGQK